MPAFATHLYIADRVLAAIYNGAGLDADNPEVRAAFRRGSIALDLDYFQSRDQLISDLAHYVSTGELATNVLISSQSDVERAFAFGWCTHVIADAELHPYINQCVGESLNGSNSEAVPYHADPKEHLRVELGLDAAFLGELPQDERPEFPQPCRDAREAALLHRAYLKTYRINLPVSELAEREHAFSGGARDLFCCSKIIDANWRGVTVPAECRKLYLTKYLPLLLLIKLVGKRHRYYGIGRCKRPEIDQQRRYRELLERVITVCTTKFNGAEMELLDLNLDTGGRASVEQSYPPQQRTEYRLREMRQAEGQPRDS